MRFGERHGYTKPQNTLQIESMNDNLRNSLWNVLDRRIWSREGFLENGYGTAPIKEFSRDLWEFFFIWQVDSRPYGGSDIFQIIRSWYFKATWYQIYEFLEYVLSLRAYMKFTDYINDAMERELAGYRFIEGICTPVTEKQEIETISQAITQGPYEGVKAHLKTALEHMSRREDPDYRNSIKESISAVESLCQEVTGNKKATLGQALKELEKQGLIHGALKKGMSNFYGYTSDEGGIRHAMLKEPNLSADDAKYFLVTCSAFVNYVISKLG